MKRGRKPTLRGAKILRGNFPQAEPPAAEPPVMPDYLSAGAQAVWQEELERVVGFGVTDADSNLFARYCTLEALFRRMIGDGEQPPIAHAVELRRMSEALGLAGPRCRVISLKPEAKQNPFSRNGQRPSGGPNG